MSLILEALKRSEQERATGDLVLDEAVHLRRPGPPRARSRNLLVALVTAAAILLSIGGAWWLMTRLTDEGAPGASSQKAPEMSEPAPAQPSVRPGTAVAPIPKALPRVTPPAAPTTTLPAVAVPKQPAVASPIEESDPAPTPSPAVEPASPAATEDAGSTKAAGVAGETGSGETAEVLRLGRLPYRIQQAVKPLRLDVHVYDADPVRRFVMINGQSYPEGAEIKPGLLVRDIQRGGVVLVWQGEAFSLAAGD